MSLYDYPKVYAGLLAPEPDLLDGVFQWSAEALGGPAERVLDPCCGPGTWLLPFAARERHVAGNDLRPSMIAEASERLRELEASHELTVGDMSALRLESGPFDLAVNLHGSIGHLPDDETVARHLATVRDHLRPGGVYLLGLCIFDGDEVDEDLWVLHETVPVDLPSGGTAAVRYESVRRDLSRREETIRVTLLTQGVPGCPQRVDEEYRLRTFPARVLTRMLRQVGGLDLVGVRAMEADDGFPDCGLTDDVGDVTLILQREES